jgi:3-phosphoshikimate 1-carboxyvinyltransferase
MSEAKRHFPETLRIEPLQRPPKARISVPGSKSITNRALILAALSEPMQGSTLRGALRSEDTDVMIAGLADLGFRVQREDGGRLLRVSRGPHCRPVPADHADLFVANSGTSMRFLTAMVSLGQGRYRLDGVTRMRERPIEDLLSALRQVGVRAHSELDNGLPPVIVDANGLDGGRVRLRGDTSSQFLSGLLMAAPLARGDILIEVDGPLVSKPYVAMTTRMMKQFGVTVDTDLASYFHVWPAPWYAASEYDIEPDASAAGYFWAAAAITQGQVAVEGLGRDSLQGDVRFVEALAEMGCSLSVDHSVIELRGDRLTGITIDMNAISDCVMTLAAVACFAKGPTVIRNVAHIRHKETDRLRALAQELSKVGALVDEFSDGLKITPGPLHGAVIETYNDHRIAMSMALVGLVTPGITIKNPGCVAKTYPGFFEDLGRLGATE